jgi:hypothetical protein
MTFKGPTKLHTKSDLSQSFGAIHQPDQAVITSPNFVGQPHKRKVNEIVLAATMAYLVGGGVRFR